MFVPVQCKVNHVIAKVLKCETIVGVALRLITKNESILVRTDWPLQLSDLAIGKHDFQID